MSVAQTETNFQDLLKALDAQADDAAALSAKKPDDAAVAAAAAEGGAAGAGGAAAGGDGGGTAAGGNPEDEDADLTKSLEAAGLVDASDLLKSLMARQDETETVLAKALGSVMKTVGSQQLLIKSLQEQVQALGSQGRGRKALLSIATKPELADLTKSLEAAGGGADDGQITPEELMAKSNAAYDAGKISGVELNTINVCLRSGWAIEPNILNKVAAASK